MAKPIVCLTLLLFLAGCSHRGYYKIIRTEKADLHDSCQISGYVFYRKDKTPLIGNSILIEHSLIFAVSDIEGKFILKAPSGKYRILADRCFETLITKDIIFKPNQMIAIHFYLN